LAHLDLLLEDGTPLLLEDLPDALLLETEGAHSSESTKVNPPSIFAPQLQNIRGLKLTIKKGFPTLQQIFGIQGSPLFIDKFKLKGNTYIVKSQRVIANPTFLENIDIKGKPKFKKSLFLQGSAKINSPTKSYRELDIEKRKKKHRSFYEKIRRLFDDLDSLDNT